MPALVVLVPWLYGCLPILAWAMAVGRARRGNARLLAAALMATIGGGGLGLILLIVYLRVAHGTASWGQVALAAYWGSAAALLWRAFSAGVFRLSLWFTRRRDGRSRGLAAETIVGLLRAGVLLVAAVSYVSAMLLIYRPRVEHAGNPTTLLNASYQDVQFSSTDGLTLRGWWIPAGRGDSNTGDGAEAMGARRTVIVCHGLGGDKASMLPVARDLAPAGFNLLVFDLRAHGQSDGQLTSFGDLERRDVLGAVRWLRENHPEQSRRIFGVGESLGAAALISAAADPSTEGQAIDALALFAPYDRLTTLVQDLADSRFVGRAGWIARHLALPVAGVQLGVNLVDYAPAAEIDKIAPRPVFIIACEHDAMVSIYASKAVYEAASQPKLPYWLKKGSRRQMLDSNDDPARALVAFFETARPML